MGALPVCPVDACGVVLPSAIGDTPGLSNHLRAHVIADVPAMAVADLGLAGCAWGDAPFHTARPRTGRSPLVAHEAVCRANPRWNLRLAAPRTPAGGRPGSPSPGAAGDAGASARAETPNLLGSDRAAWERARRGFLAAVPATADGWAPFVASSARTLPSPPPALRRAWQLLGADALSWALRAPDKPLAWLWVLLLPTLLLHHPAPAGAALHAPLTYAARAAAIFAGEFAVALADRDAGVWRSAPGRAGTPSRPQDLGGGVPGTPPEKLTAFSHV